MDDQRRTEVTEDEVSFRSVMPSDPETDPSYGRKPPEKPKRFDLWRPLLLLGAVILMMILAKLFNAGEQLAALRGWIASLGPLGPLVFMLIYICATVLALPGSVLSVFAGAVFGSLSGVVIVIFAATIGAGLCFLIARYFARQSVSAWVTQKETFQRLDRLSESHGAIIVAITRLLPIFPFNLLNYGFGLTRVPFWTYMLWSFVCMLPGTILYVAGADAVIQVISGGAIPLRLIALVIAVLLTALLLARLAARKLVQKEAAERANAGAEVGLES